MDASGRLRESFRFERDMASSDWSGHPSDPDWQAQFTAAAGIKFMRGSEAVLSARLTARQPAILTIRNSANGRAIRPSDRAVNTRTGEIFNIREKPRESRENRGFLEMLVESGAT